MGFECYSIGDLLLDVGTQEVTRDGSVVPVPRLSFKLLLTLARQAPNIVSPDQLEKEVWEGLVVDRGTINKRVLLLRKALGNGQDADPYIAVTRGRGYRLVVPVKRLESCPGEETPQTTAAEPGFRMNSRLVRQFSYGLLALVLIFVLYKGLQGTPGEVRRPAQAETDAGEVSPVTYSKYSIAVLPFVDLNDDQVHQYIGDGISEEVITLLAGMDDLVVAARTSSFSFRDSPATVEEIAAKLKVGTVLEGSIRHADGQIRVSVQLVDANSGHHIWSRNYDRSFDQIFEVQDDIALNISQSLRLTLDVTKQLDSRRQMTGDIDAFKHYLKGRELLNKRISLRAEGLQQALKMFNMAIDEDPKFARAHAGVANVYWLLAAYDNSLDKESYFEQAESSANFALAIDPDSIDALSALAAISSRRGSFALAARYFDEARSLSPLSSNIIAWDATLHIRLGYFDELIDQLTETYARDPLNEHIAWALSDALIYSGYPQEAAEILRGLEHFSYRDYYLGLCAIYVGDFAAARELLRGVSMRSGDLPANYADLLIDGLEDSSLFEDTVASFLSAVENGNLSKQVVFEVLLILGSPKAFTLPIRPFADIAKTQIHAQVWNNWTVGLRQDPRFKDWVTSIGYVDFWREHGWPDRCRPTGLDDFECI